MDHFDFVNRAIAYIETQLMQPITTTEVAVATGYSRAHLGRLFLAMTGETLAGYIRKRRLSEAAYKLVTARDTILDLALDYQFQSQEAFTRSFKQHFRRSPGAYRRRGHFTGAFHRITLRRLQIHHLYDVYGKTGKGLPLDRSAILSPQIKAVQFCALLVKHSELKWGPPPLIVPFWYG